jgi:ubiquinone/menaquinone biosynthesis C-methylase UbiE
MSRLVTGFKSRWRRQVIGRAYETAREVAEVIPPDGRVLDVGCGHGFVAYHLTAMRGSNVVGLDLANRVDAPINYLSYDGRRFPVTDGSFDSVLLCYVLHHTQDLSTILNEVSRVLSKDGVVVVYEDIPQTWWDRIPLWAHNRKWQSRTGPCTFRSEPEWRSVFSSYGFEIVAENPLSRWSFLFHPVAHIQYVLRYRDSDSPAANN